MARCLLLGAQRQQSAGMRSCRSCAFPDQRPLAPALLESSRDPFCHSFAQNFAPCGTGAARLPIFGWFFLPEAVFGGGKERKKGGHISPSTCFWHCFFFPYPKCNRFFGAHPGAGLGRKVLPRATLGGLCFYLWSCPAAVGDHGGPRTQLRPRINRLAFNLTASRGKGGDGTA